MQVMQGHSTNTYISAPMIPRKLISFKINVGLIVKLAIVTFIFSTVTVPSFATEPPPGCQTPPGLLSSGAKPYDYRVDKDKLPIVENAHFTPEVERLVRGKSALIEADLAYTLNVFPNHIRALAALVRYGDIKHVEKFPVNPHSIECYIRRAVDFRNDDLNARFIYASYLAKKNRKADAVEQLNFIEANGEESPLMNYNMGLIYFQIGEYDSALVNARKAYGNGVLFPALKQKLIKAGKWSE
jgi:hypothetical protein